MPLVNCVHISINGVTRRKTLRSLIRQFGFEILNAQLALVDTQKSISGIIVTDLYEGTCSTGFLDGSNKIPPDKVRDFFSSSLNLGCPVWLCRHLIGQTLLNRPEPTKDLIIPRIKKSVRFAEFDFGQELPVEILFEMLI